MTLRILFKSDTWNYLEPQGTAKICPKNAIFIILYNESYDTLWHVTVDSF